MQDLDGVHDVLCLGLNDFRRVHGIKHGPIEALGLSKFFFVVVMKIWIFRSY